MNNDLQAISNWTFQWKMQFKPDPNKQTQEVYFSKKSINKNSLSAKFNNAKVVTCSTHKHLINIFKVKRIKLQDDWSHQKIICKFSPRGFINHFLYLIWITETLFMANHITSFFKTKSKIFNIKLDDDDDDDDDELFLCYG